MDSIYNISQGDLLSVFIKIASIGNQSFIFMKISDLILQDKLLISYQVSLELLHGNYVRIYIIIYIFYEIDLYICAYGGNNKYE